MATKQIGEYTYTLSPLPVRTAREVTFRLGKAMARGRGFAQGENPIERLGTMLMGALEGLAFDDLEWIIQAHERCCTVRIGEKEPQLSDVATWWQGREADSIAWIAWAVEVTCGPFFRGLRDVVFAKAAALAAGKPPSPSPPPSTG